MYRLQIPSPSHTRHNDDRHHPVLLHDTHTRMDGRHGCAGVRLLRSQTHVMPPQRVLHTEDNMDVIGRCRSGLVDVLRGIHHGHGVDAHLCGGNERLSAGREGAPVVHCVIGAMTSSGTHCNKPLDISRISTVLACDMGAVGVFAGDITEDDVVIVNGNKIQLQLYDGLVQASEKASDTLRKKDTDSSGRFRSLGFFFERVAERDARLANHRAFDCAAVVSRSVRRTQDERTPDHSAGSYRSAADTVAVNTAATRVVFPNTHNTTIPAAHVFSMPDVRTPDDSRRMRTPDASPSITVVSPVW